MAARVLVRAPGRRSGCGEEKGVGRNSGAAWAAVHGLPLMLLRAREGSRPEAGVAVDGRGYSKGLRAAQG